MPWLYPCGAKPCLLKKPWISVPKRKSVIITISLDIKKSVLICDNLWTKNSVGKKNSVDNNKLSIYHCRPESLAQHSESDIRHVLHRSEKQRSITKFYISNLHSSFFCPQTFLSTDYHRLTQIFKYQRYFDYHRFISVIINQ